MQEAVMQDFSAQKATPLTHPAGAGQAVADVGGNAVGEQAQLLRHHSQLRSEPLRIKISQVHPIRQHLQAMHSCIIEWSPPRLP